MNRPLIQDTTIVSAALLPFAKTFEVDKGADSQGWELLVKVFKGGYLKSRFEIAKDLESAGWDVDDNMLDAISDVEGNQHQLHNQAVKDWVQANAITPKLALGDPVNVKRRNEAHTGTITNIYADTAQYVVSIPALGHVDTGLGTRGWVIPFEELHPLAAAPEDFQLQAQAG